MPQYCCFSLSLSPSVPLSLMLFTLPSDLSISTSPSLHLCLCAVDFPTLQSSLSCRLSVPVLAHSLALSHYFWSTFSFLFFLVWDEVMLTLTVCIEMVIFVLVFFLGLVVLWHRVSFQTTAFFLPPRLLLPFLLFSFTLVFLNQKAETGICDRQVSFPVRVSFTCARYKAI